MIAATVDDITSSTQPSSAPAADPRRFAVLACFCLHSAFQNFCFMNFATDQDLVNKMLGEPSALENLLLSYGAFAATLPAMICSMWLLLRGYDRSAGLIMSVLIVLGAWLRYAAEVSHSYAYALISTVVLGLAGGVIFTSITFLPARWFPASERAFATALAAQSNYLGWAIGAINPIMLGKPAPDGEHTEEGMHVFLLCQAIAVTLLLPLHLMINVRGPIHAVAQGDDKPDEPTMGVVQTFRLLLRRPQYLIHCGCYALLGAVGYAVPEVVETCFSAVLPNATDASFTPDESMWSNVAFIAPGVVVGILSGKLVPERHYGTAVRAMAVLGAAALLTIQILLLIAQRGSIGKDEIYGLATFLMALAGAGTLGFINIAMRVAIKIGHPADEIYAGSIIEFFLLAISCALGLLTVAVDAKNTFWFFSLPACLAAGDVILCARFEPPAARVDLTDGLLGGVATSPSVR